MSTPLILALRTHAQWLGATGLDLTNLYLCEDADTQLTDSVGAENLAAGGTGGPFFQQEGEFPGRVGVRFADLSDHHFVGGAGTFADDGVTSWLLLEFATWVAAPTGAQLFGRWVTGTPADRFTLSSTGGNLIWALGDGVGATATAQVSGDHDGQTFVCATGVNRSSNRGWVCSPLGQAEVDIAGRGAFGAGGNPFRLGHWSSASSTGRTTYVFARAAGVTTELSTAQQIALVARLNGAVSHARTIVGAGGIGLV